jgi:hypothetical protein
MCMCMCICMYVYTYMHTHSWNKTRRFMQVPHTHTCKYAHTHITQPHPWTRRCLPTGFIPYTHTYTCNYTHMQLHTHTCNYTKKTTHTQTSLTHTLEHSWGIPPRAVFRFLRPALVEVIAGRAALNLELSHGLSMCVCMCMYAYMYWYLSGNAAFWWVSEWVSIYMYINIHMEVVCTYSCVCIYIWKWYACTRVIEQHLHLP